MHKIILCDDNKEYLKMLEMLMSKYADVYGIEIICFYSADDLLDYCRNNPFDIVYMDVLLEEKRTGMDLGRILKIINPHVLLIYISSYEGFFERMVNAEPFRFISKSRDIEQLEKDMANVLDAAIKRVEGTDSWHYIYKREPHSIEFSKIQYFQSFGRKVYIHANRKTEHWFYGKINEVQKEIQKTEGFARISNRVIVNTVHTFFVKKNKVEVGNTIFTVSPQYREEFNKKYGDHLAVHI